MKKKRRNFIKVKKLSFDNSKDKRYVEKYAYQDYLRKQNKKLKDVDYKHLEKIFTNEVYYKAMKKLSPKEKQVIYLLVFDSNDLEKVCSEMKKSKKDVIQIKANAIKHFKRNINKYKKLKKNGGAVSGK